MPLSSNRHKILEAKSDKDFRKHAALDNLISVKE